MNQNTLNYRKIFAFFVAIGLGLASNVQAQNPGAARAMNPDIGANFLVESQKSTSTVNDGMSLREAEFSLKSDVDPYFTANMIFSVERSDANPKEYTISPEEVYLDTTFIPGFTLRAGKFYGAFGKHNTLHTHAFPFVTAPLINGAVLGDEGLNAAGVSASYLIPTSFFSEITVQGFENFKSLAHLRSLFELNDDSTLEVGVSGVTKWAYGADLTYKHRPTDRGMGRKFSVAGEWMSGQLDGYTTAPTLNGTPTQGFAVYTQYEFLPRTFGEYRFDDLISGDTTRHGVLLGYAPSEFSVFRVQYDYTKANGGEPEHRVIAQINITIGFHPAHDY
jgi:hypothetical protein